MWERARSGVLPDLYPLHEHGDYPATAVPASAAPVSPMPPTDLSHREGGLLQTRMDSH